MSDILIRKTGHAGHITFNRLKALNALSHEMALAIEAALDEWRSDGDVALVIIDAEGEKAFCAGGDIADIYDSGKRGDLEYGRKFWRDEYRMNAKIFEYPKPIVSFMQGFTMGGGVGVGCHGNHRIVGESTQIAMPECGIGLVPDVGGSFILAKAPGRLGEYLAITGQRMGAADAILAGFADHFVPQERWDDLKAALIESGNVSKIPAHKAPAGKLAADRAEIDSHFAGGNALAIAQNLRGADESDFTRNALRIMDRSAPLAMSCAVQILHRLRGTSTIREALAMEFRYTSRAVEQGDFIEGIRAAIIDKDRQPKWTHSALEDVSAQEVEHMLSPITQGGLNWEDMP